MNGIPCDDVTGSFLFNFYVIPDFCSKAFVTELYCGFLNKIAVAAGLASCLNVDYVIIIMNNQSARFKKFKDQSS